MERAVESLESRGGSNALRVIIGVVILLAGISTGAAWVNYQPVSIVSPQSVRTIVLASNGNSVPRSAIEVGTLGGEVLWDLPAGPAVLHMRATLRNAGPLPVRIVNVTTSLEQTPALKSTAFAASMTSAQWSDAKRPFMIPAHTSVIVNVSQRLGCFSFPKLTWSLSTLRITTEFLGVHHVLNLPIAPFALKIPASCSN